MKKLPGCAGFSNLATSMVTALLIGENSILCYESSTATCLAKNACLISKWPTPRPTATSDSKSSSFGGRVRRLQDAMCLEEAPHSLRELRAAQHERRVVIAENLEKLRGPARASMKFL